MAAKIWVPVKRRDRIEEIVPHIEKVAEPGGSVVFLIHHPVSGFKRLQACCGIAQHGLEKTRAVKRMIESYSLETRVQLAQRRVFQTCGALHDTGLNMTADVYSGSLSNALRSHANNEEGQLVVMRPGIGQRVMSVLHGPVSVSSLFSRGFSSSTLLLHTGK